MRLEADLSLCLLQQETIAAFGEFAIKTISLDELLDECVRLVARTLDVELCKILQLYPAQAELLLKAGVGVKPGQVGKVTVGTGSDTQAGYTWLTEEPVIVEDLRTETRFIGGQLLHDHHILSGVSVIIGGTKAPWGILGAHSTSLRAFTQYDAQFLRSIANLLASAIERLEIEAQLRRSRDELSIVLNGVSEGITAQAKDGSLIYANQSAAETMGYNSIVDLLNAPLDEVRGKFEIFDETGQLLPPDNLPGQRVFRGESEASAKLRFYRPQTDEERWAIASAAPVLNSAGEVSLAVNIFRDVTDMVLAERSQKLLAEAGKLFAEASNSETALTALANLVAENLADWCIVHLTAENEQVRQLAVAHRDPARVQMAYELERQYPPDWNVDCGVQRVLRTGQPEYYPEITDALLQASARDAEHLAVLRELEFHSVMIVPLRARSGILGAVTLIWAESGRKYNQVEVQLVQELAHRAGIAIENLQLYQESLAINTQLEDMVETRTRQLTTSNRLLLKEIEERRKAAAALRKSETMLQSLFESAPDATVLIDSAGTIIQVNRQAEAVFGYQRSELIGNQIDFLLPQRYRSSHAKHRAHYFDHLVTRPMGAGLALSAVRKDGQEFPVDVMLSPVFTEEGTLVISAIRDITERKQLETDLAETHRRLFEGVEAERLLLSQELHDGPIQDLYGVSLRLEGLREALRSQQDEESLDACRDALQAVGQTLRGICGELRPPALTHFGLEKAIRSHLIQFQNSHPGLAIESSLMQDGQTLPERTRLALYRVYQNSLSNIIRHAQAKSVRISLSVEEEQVSLRIEDDGCGFTVPERWIELARAGHYGLVGMVERVEAIGGKITVHSSIGQGTTIQVDVPVNHAVLEGGQQQK